MKNLFRSRISTVAMFLLVTIAFTSCVHVHHPRHRVTVVKHKRIPPGHAKKISGHKSARRHAPGHNK